MSTAQFSLAAFREATRLVIRACGRLTLGHGAEETLWAPQLVAAGESEVALDLSCLTDVDARGLGVLADLGRRALQRGIKLSVLSASGVTRRLARLTRLDRAIPGNWRDARGHWRACHRGIRPNAVSCGMMRP
jgi:anti-anti-sigma regulatory factor